MKKLVCLGDSLTYGYKTARHMTWVSIFQKITGIETENAGVNGDTTSGMLSRLQIIAASGNYTHMLIMGGANDLMWGTPMGIVQSNIAALVHQTMHYRIKPLLGIPLPVDAEKAAEFWPLGADFKEAALKLSSLRSWLYTFGAFFKIPVIDFYGLFIDNGNLKSELLFDGLHPSEEGHCMMAELLKSKFE